jgi:phosphoribosyl-AMP cyclohydrolase
MDTSDAPDFAKRGGLITAIAQDHATGEILMVAYMSQESFRRTLELGEAVYYSTSREELWHKGQSSGNIQVVKEMLLDCDGDALLLKVEQRGDAACHTGRRSCFFRKREGDGWKDVGVQVFDPKKVYGK